MDENKLIAEFMGINVGEYTSYPEEFITQYAVVDLQYHESWDWLMPVVEKIKDMGCEVVMTNGACTISAIGYHARSFGKSRRDATYNAVIEFIKQNEDE